jgi:SAM-dependent methyltransferase
MSSANISQLLGEHYARKFAEHGTRPEGVDWGPDPADHLLRLDRMLALTEMGRQPGATHSILDVGCGYGSLLELIDNRGLQFPYTGIDICEPMIQAAREKHPNAEWLVGDVLDLDASRQFDYVVCNGILTQKLGATIQDMDRFLKTIVTKMFGLCRIGIAFNVMTTHVNFTAPNLYYRNPAELLAWCMSELTPRIRLDHAYPMFEYTLYLYREDAPGLVYGAHRSVK